jgi:hypothetical protein
MTIGLEGRAPFPGSTPIPDNLANSDLLAVYPGHTEDPLRGPLLWRNMEKNGLNLPELKALQKFKKQVEESEKASKR